MLDYLGATSGSPFPIPFGTHGLAAENPCVVREQGYLEPTPIQRRAIPVILKGHGIMAGAQTSTARGARPPCICG